MWLTGGFLLAAVLFAVLLSVLTAPSFGVPVRIHKRGAWHHPCGQFTKTESHGGKPGDPARHEITKLIRAVKTQINISNRYFKKEEKTISNLYHQVQNELREINYQYDWLPQKQLLWYKNVRCLDKQTRLQKVLQLFHSSLQNYSVTFAELKKHSPAEYPMTDLGKRRDVIEGITQHHNQILCEVEFMHEILNIEIPERVADDLLFKKKDKWSSDPDVTASKIQDWGVISQYKTFLKEWSSIIMKVNKNSATCKNSENSSNKRRKKPKH
ncbi:hypothetical protein ANN_18495 [Periplaneta americana]|uniref:Uncharacterized protein n=1 Tax=Periplaneta americana TaxID=6978 RepID=A0ABQ8SQ70_PERAM|nr:hypothetical protein ANN_18495 [Periplaneta americana]